jgi:hypothetical protein
MRLLVSGEPVSGITLSVLVAGVAACAAQVGASVRLVWFSARSQGLTILRWWCVCGALCGGLAVAPLGPHVSQPCCVAAVGMNASGPLPFAMVACSLLHL